MTNALGAQTQINNLIESTGSTITIYAAVSFTRDEWGTITSTTASTGTAKAVPDDNLLFKREALPEGILKNASTIIIAKAGVGINQEDEVDYNGTRYKVISIRDFVLSNVSLGTEIALGEKYDN